MNEAQLVKTIKAHIDKGDKAAEKSEQHYIAAGQHLKTLKAGHDGSWAEWEALLKDKIRISAGRASELMQIADGRKTVAQIRADKAESMRRLRASSPRGEDSAGDPEAQEERDRQEVKRLWQKVQDAEAEARQAADNGGDPEASAEARKAEYEGFVDDDGNPISHEKVEEQLLGGPEAVAALRMVERMSEENRATFLEALADRYPDDDEFTIYSGAPDEAVVRTLVEAIGVDRTRALGKNISSLIFKAIGRAALPDCVWCKGSGVTEGDFYGRPIKYPCECTRRRRHEDFNALRARLERQSAERAIPQQDFSFGLEVKTKDGRVWASGVRLPTEEEVGFYIDYWARHELRKHGYATWESEPNYDLLGFETKRYDERPMMKISGGKRKTLNFLHGTCGLLGPKGWRPISGGECDCKKCKDDRAFWEKYEKENEAA